MAAGNWQKVGYVFAAATMTIAGALWYERADRIVYGRDVVELANGYAERCIAHAIGADHDDPPYWPGCEEEYGIGIIPSYGLKSEIADGTRSLYLTHYQQDPNWFLGNVITGKPLISIETYWDGYDEFYSLEFSGQVSSSNLTTTADNSDGGMVGTATIRPYCWANRLFQDGEVEAAYSSVVSGTWDRVSANPQFMLISDTNTWLIKRGELDEIRSMMTNMTRSAYAFNPVDLTTEFEFGKIPDAVRSDSEACPDFDSSGDLEWRVEQSSDLPRWRMFCSGGGTWYRWDSYEWNKYEETGKWIIGTPSAENVLSSKDVTRPIKMSFFTCKEGEMWPCALAFEKKLVSRIRIYAFFYQSDYESQDGGPLWWGHPYVYRYGPDATVVKPSGIFVPDLPYINVSLERNERTFTNEGAARSGLVPTLIFETSDYSSATNRIDVYFDRKFGEGGFNSISTYTGQDWTFTATNNSTGRPSHRESGRSSSGGGAFHIYTHPVFLMVVDWNFAHCINRKKEEEE